MKFYAIFFLTGLSLLLPANEKVLFSAPEEFFIRLHDNKVWTLPPWDGKGRIVVQFEQRLDFPRLAGWAPCWQILVNEKLISAMADRNTPRLLNKGLTAIHSDHGMSQVCKGEKWYALYSPDFEQAITKFLPADQEAYRIKLDISDMLSRNTENTLRIRFGAELENYYRNWGIKRKPALAVRNFKIIHDPTSTTLKPLRPEKKFVKVRKLPRCTYTVQEQQDGFQVSFGGRSYQIKTSLSVPGERKKRLSLNDDNPFYSVKRKIIKKNNRIDIFDTFTSKSDKLIGIRIAYEMDSAPFPYIYLAGDKNPSRAANQDGRNPSVFCPVLDNDTGIALLAQDDVFRVQNIQYCKNGKTGIRTDSFALSPGESRTVEWSVYPVMSADYFDFINEVRRDWDVNFTIPGEISFSMNVFRDWAKEPHKALHFHKINGIKANIYGVHYWRHLGDAYKNRYSAVFGTALMKDVSRVNIAGKIEVRPVEELRRFEREMFKKAKEIIPDLKRFLYLHTQWSTEVDDYKIYADSIQFDKKGKIYTGIEEPYHFFIPTLKNSYGKALLKTIDFMCTTYDTDGIYIDEMNSSPCRLSYDKWDGVSVELDRYNNVAAKIGFVPLLKLQFMLKAMEKIINEHNKLLIGNFSPETRSERKFRFPRFEETFNSWWIYYSHLYTPIQLGDVSTYGRTPQENMADIRNAMKNGALYYHYANTSASPTITQKMFPFTPVEIHSRWLMGKERILTCISGEFGWHDSKQLAGIFVYDKYGKETSDYQAEVFASGAETRIRLHLRPGQCAALIAIPVEAELQGDVVLDSPRYKDGVFRCKRRGSGTVILKKQGVRKVIPANQSDIEF